MSEINSNTMKISSDKFKAIINLDVLSHLTKGEKKKFYKKLKRLDLGEGYSMNSKILLEYKKLVEHINAIPDSMKDKFSEELYRRHKGGWRLPPSVYLRRRDILFYKESLERNSPYYIDLLKIEDQHNLELVLIDLYNTIRIK